MKDQSHRTLRPMAAREVPDRSGSPWPVIIIGGLALFGAISLVQWVFGFLFGLAKVAIVIAIVAAAVLLVRGPRADT